MAAAARGGFCPGAIQLARLATGHSRWGEGEGRGRADGVEERGVRLGGRPKLCVETCGMETGRDAISFHYLAISSYFKFSFHIGKYL